MCARDVVHLASYPDRRSFLKTIAAGAAGAAVGRRADAAPIPQGGASATPLGMLAARLDLSGTRLTGDGVPAYTPEFVLADVALSPERRFNEFSGDLSGRYIGALATAQAGSATSLAPLVRSLVSYQRTDGRFGDAGLAFTADAVGPTHMALLWGNGRLLVGLLEYHAHHPDPATLDAARRLADFLVAVRKACADPAVMKRVEGQGANGFICFTQLIEGLVMAERATGDARYLETAAAIAPLLPPRGIQHSHGYLSTLRGVMLLHDATRDRRWLDFVVERYGDLLVSSDYTIYGSVLEYFGWNTAAVTAAERQRLLDASGQHPRDEGCSSADFVRLSLQLWKATGEPEYLHRAELALENALYPNQWETGDFGSRVTFDRGLMPTANAARCWWCCTMHGHRALADVRDVSIHESSGQLYFTLLGETRITDGRVSASARREILGNGRIRWHLEGTGLSHDTPVFIRILPWASLVGSAELAGRRVEGPTAMGFYRAVPDLGGRLSLRWDLRPSLRLRTRKGDVREVAAIGAEPVEAALSWGPWLLAVDEAREPLFFGEPWQENVVSLPRAETPSVVDGDKDLLPAVVVNAAYEHGGFGGRRPVTLTPLARQSIGPQRTLAVWLKYRTT